jgi:hypothetical protein
MAFTTTFKSKIDGSASDAFNVDFSIGFGARGNRPDDIMLAQALFRILHFELREVGAQSIPPPSGVTSIAVDGVLGPVTAKCILGVQQRSKSIGMPVLLDGILDPFRDQQQLSTVAHVRYALEILNDTAFVFCKRAGVDNYTSLPRRTDVPRALTSALQQRRQSARQYQKGLSPA